MKDRLRPFFCDHLSIMRSKWLPEHKIGAGVARFAQPTYSVHYDKDLIIDAPGTECLAGLPDMELRWSDADIRDGWAPGMKVVTGDLFDAAEAPIPMYGRHRLKAAVEDWKALGLSPKIGIELEAFAFQRGEDGVLVPYDTPGGVVYGTGPLTDPLGISDAIWEAAEKMGFAIDMFTSEYDTPQFEFTLTFDDAVRAVDDIVLFRQMAREVAIEHGVLLTFMPKPLEDKGGSGMHINLSFVDEAGNNALADGDTGGVEAMTDFGKGCIAGWMQHHKGLAALLAPSANSYDRLQPASLSGYWRNWGGDHRGVTARVSGEGGPKARLEHRMADAAANPHAAVAAILQAARLGVEGNYALPAMETGDCFTGQDATDGTAETLALALDDLEADKALCAAMSDAYCAHHLHMKRSEVEKTASLDFGARRDFYIWYV